jgi:hypothetical protein
MKTISEKWGLIVLFILFGFFTAWWVYMTVALPKDNSLYTYFGTLYGVIALWGGIWGIIISRAWGGFKSLLGRAILMFSIGLFLQEFGQCAYTYYVLVLHVDIPYPSLGDLGFFGTIPFYIYGAYLLAKVAGVKISLRSYKSKLQAIIIPTIMLLIAYGLFVYHYSLSSIDLTKPLETFLNFGYPFGQAIYISIGILTYSLTRNLLGGIMKSRILFLIIAFGAQFLADYLFIFFSDKYYSGSILDYFYVFAYFLMGLAIFEFKNVVTKLKASS